MWCECMNASPCGGLKVRHATVAWSSYLKHLSDKVNDVSDNQQFRVVERS